MIFDMKYLSAFFEEGPNFVKLSSIYSPESFAMVHERNSEIEKLTQVVLECQEDSRRISIQGNEESIRAAKQIIEDLVKGKSPSLTSPAMCATDIETDGGLCVSLQGSHHLWDSHNNNIVSTDGKLSSSSSCEALDACVRWQPRRESLHCEASLFPSGMDIAASDGSVSASVDLRTLPSDAGDKLDFPGHSVDNDHLYSSPPTHSSASSPSPPSPSPSGLQDSQKEVRKGLQDQELKVQKALRLGYSEEDALMALERVGLDAGENDYLAELISLGSKSSNSMDSDRSPFTSGDLEFSTGFGIATSLSERNETGDEGDNLRYIVIDGSNVAMSHGKKEVFSCRGIRLAVDWFRQRGHKQIKVFVPQWRKETSRPEAPITDQDILTQLEKEDVLVFTPARRIGSKRIVCYDDRYVLKLAAEVDGIVVSNDNYRDLLNASPDYRKVVEERLLMYSFVDDKFMPPDDPLGRKGPTLDNFLRIRPTVPEPLPPECPYGKKCTYGNKCRYYHPERGCLPHKSVTDKLAEQAKLKLQERSARLSEVADKKGKKMKPKTPLARTISCVPTQFMGDAGSTVPSQGKEGMSEADLQLQRSQSLVEKRDYNEMLDEHRRKLNLALERAAEPKHLPLARHAELGERSSAPIDSSRRSPTVLIQGPHPPTAPSQAMDTQLLMPQTIPSPTLETDGVSSHPSPSRSPPSSQLLAPASQASERKGFFGGHLMLAKKLSDESQKFFDDPDKDKNQTAKDGEGITRSSSAGVIDYLATTTAVSMSQGAVSADTLHQAIAQMSFPTRQHSSPRHSAPSTQHSRAPPSSYCMDAYYGQGERCVSGPVGQGRSQMDSMISMRGYHGDHCQSFPLMERSLSHHQALALQQQQQQQKQQGFIDGGLQQRHAQLMGRQAGFQGTLYDDSLYSGEHLGLTRLQSAPSHLYQTTTQPQPRPITRMARQNSSSDPQLHTTGMDEVPELGLLSRSTMPYPSSDSNMAGLDLFESSPSHHPHHPGNHPHTHPHLHHQQQHPHHSPHHQPPQAYPRSSSFHPGNFVSQPHFLGMSRQSSYPVPPQPLPPHHMHPAWQDSAAAGRYSASDPWAVSGGLMSPPSASTPNSPHMPLTSQSAGRTRQVPQFNPDAEILPSDPRYNLYFHLCGLFPPAKVRMVMNQHPNETNAQELCSYIIGLK